jgi:hypothetical protein
MPAAEQTETPEIREFGFLFAWSFKESILTSMASPLQQSKEDFVNA